MMPVLLVKGKEHDTCDEETDSIPHGTAVMLKLLKPWLNDQGTPRLVCGDSYFARVPAVVELRKHGFFFIGVIKTATKQYPLAWFDAQELSSRCQHKQLISVNEEG